MSEDQEWRQGQRVSFSLESAKVLFNVLVELDCERGVLGKCEDHMGPDGYCRVCTAMNFLQLSILDTEEGKEWVDGLGRDQPEKGREENQ